MPHLSASTGNAAGAIAFGWLIVAVIIGLYFIPTIVAAMRHVPNVGSVAVVNIFLGWTLIGWVVAMAMASRSAASSTVVNVQQGYQGHPQQGYGGHPQLGARPPGWYPEADGQWVQYWDGAQWTARGPARPQN